MCYTYTYAYMVTLCYYAVFQVEQIYYIGICIII